MRTVFKDKVSCIEKIDGKVIAVAAEAGSLYYLECEADQGANAAACTEHVKEHSWHHRYGNLSEGTL